MEAPQHQTAASTFRADGYCLLLPPGGCVLEQLLLHSVRVQVFPNFSSQQSPFLS